MAAARLLPTIPLVLDGRLHRFDVEGDRRSSRNGWYVIRAAARPTAIYGSWRTGERHTWRVERDEPLSRHEREALRAERERRRAGERQAQERAARRAGEIWDRCMDVDPAHPYLRVKGVAAHGLRQWYGLLVVPLRDVSGRLWSLQFINPAGEKRFLRGGRVRGLFHVIGRPTPRTWIVEGYATGVSVHEHFGSHYDGPCERRGRATCTLGR